MIVDNENGRIAYHSIIVTLEKKTIIQYDFDGTELFSVEIPKTFILKTSTTP